MPTPFGNIPGVSANVVEKGLQVAIDESTPTVLIIGATTSTTAALEEPTRIVRREDINTYDNADGTPSEISYAAQEAVDGGAANIEVYVLSDGSGRRYNGAEELDIENTLDPASSGPSHRYSLLQRGYDSLLHHRGPDVITPAGDTYIDSTGLETTQNFGWQLAEFCYNRDRFDKASLGVIGVTPPTANVKSTAAGTNDTPTLAQQATWVTNLAAFNTSTQIGSAFTIADGVTDSGGDGIPDSYAFWAVTGSDSITAGTPRTIPTGSPPQTNGTVKKDVKGNAIDIGKYLSVCANWVRHVNYNARRQFAAKGYYNRTMAATYAGLIAASLPNEGLISKPLSAQVIRDMSPAQVNNLTGKRYVVAKLQQGQLVINDSPTFAHNVSTTSRSDFVNLSTMRITQGTVEAIREAARPFLGKGSTAVSRSALHTAIDEKLAKLRDAGYYDAPGFRIEIKQDPTSKVLGRVKVDVVIYPALEIKEVAVTVALSVSSVA